MKISVAIATYNEEKNLAACLQSAQGLADEIVIVDGSSTDKTVTIAKKFGAKVTITDNPPIFHINKQKALDRCCGDWILQLDADERVTPALKEEIKRVINSELQFNGYWLPRRNYFLGDFLKKGGQYPDYTLRLYRRGKGYLPCRSVHEQAVVEGKVGFLKHDLEHYPFLDFGEYLNKANRYAYLLAAEYETQRVGLGMGSMFKYFFLFPVSTFGKIFFRHLGFVDGLRGFIFALYSAIQKMTAYLIYLEKTNVGKND